MILKKLKKEHYFTPIFEILNELSPVDESIPYSEFEEWYDTLPHNHHIYILENDKREVMGMGTLLIESKIIHRFGKVGHIEDIIISKKYRGKGFGKFLVESLIHIAEEDFKVYKVILNCSDSNIPFYENCGFKKKENQMIKYFIS